MKRNKRVSVVGVLALLLTVVFVFSTNALAGQPTVTGAVNEDYQVVADTDYDDSGAWTNEGDNDSEGEAEQTDEGSWESPGEADEESPTETPSDEEDFPPAYQDDTAMESDTE